MGPVWMPWIPIVWKARHSRSSASVDRTEAPGAAAMVEAG
jgi:hypothetical protein